MKHIKMLPAVNIHVRIGGGGANKLWSATRRKKKIQVSISDFFSSSQLTQLWELTLNVLV